MTESLKELRREQAVIQKDNLKSEKTLERQRNELAEMKPELVQTEEQISHVQKKFKQQTETRAKLEKECEKKKSEIAVFKSQLSELIKAKSVFEGEPYYN